ncbi:hypothetical protein CcCBS67573_g10288 [Chytriomyces confervae]|uniref:Response regulatory domain-containing protein n=1 Tax=Chytriomyces confervae TaxID=246404 RepID=A0A507D604_9FUNG|nr:hypothetical protein CcCBS67573_g10288 [Chytriomyces confervae]
MDLEMPIMSGEEASARIRSLGITIPIVAVTGNSIRGDDVNPLRQAGISEIVKKPVERQKIYELCRALVQFPDTPSVSGFNLGGHATSVTASSDGIAGSRLSTGTMASAARSSSLMPLSASTRIKSYSVTGAMRW